MNEELNIPIYRAKKKDSDESVEGFLRSVWQEKNSDDKEYITAWFISGFHNGNDDRIDPSTLAIHFPDMIDSEGKKIFASLSEDGKGGDVLEYATVRMGVVRYYKNQIMCGEVSFGTLKAISRSAKVTGIQD